MLCFRLLILSPLNEMLSMKQLFMAVALAAPGLVMAQKVGLRHEWTTDAVFKTPESIVYEKQSDRFYVTNVDGIPSEKDGKGAVSVMTREGKVLSANWITGLNAPKGITTYNGKLYVADLDEVVTIDIATASITQKLKIENAIGLNDITVDEKGNLFVSDKQGKCIYKIVDGKVSLFLSELQQPNGLVVLNGNLYVLDNGSLLKIDPSQGITNVAFGMLASTDGLVHIPGKGFIISCWEGSIYHVTESGKQTLLMDTRAEKKNTADLFYDTETGLLYVPTFYQNTIEVYKVE